MSDRSGGDELGARGRAGAGDTLVRLADGSYAAAAAVEQPRRRRRRWPWAVMVLLVIGAGGVAGAVWFLADDTDQQYVSALADAGFGDLFPAERAAVTHAESVCARFDANEPVEGYESERIAVEYYCDDYLDAYEVIPTPEELAADYYDALSEQRLTSQFADQEEAVVAAERLCGTLEAGDKPQGFEADLVGVEYYCPMYADRFKVLERKTVTGTFTIIDSDPSTYYPSIESIGGLCYGSGGYSDLNNSTSVVITSASGETLGRTELGLGDGMFTRCEFEFSVELVEGEDDYVVAVGDRGEISYSWSEITSPGAIALTIGD